MNRSLVVVAIIAVLCMGTGASASTGRLLSGWAGLKAVVVGTKVISGNFSHATGLNSGDEIAVNVTTAAAEAVLISGDFGADDNACIGATGTFCLNGVAIDYSAADTVSHLASSINAVCWQMDVIACTAGDGTVRMSTFRYGTSAAIAVTSGADILVGGAASAAAIGTDAAASVTIGVGGDSVSDASWQSGGGLTLSDSLGNMIELTEAGGSVVNAAGVQFRMVADDSPAISVTVSPAMVAAGDDVSVVVIANDPGVRSVEVDHIGLSGVEGVWYGDITAQAGLGNHVVPVVVTDSSGNSTTDTTGSYTTAPVVGINIKSLADPIMASAASHFLFRVWGKASQAGTSDCFYLEQGAGSAIRVSAQHYVGLMDGDIASARGILDLAANPVTLWSDRTQVQYLFCLPRLRANIIGSQVLSGDFPHATGLVDGDHIAVNVTTAASKAWLISKDFGADDTACIGANGTFYLNGVRIDYLAPTTVSALAQLINGISDQTGVTASTDSHGMVMLSTADYGASATIYVTGGSDFLVGGCASAAAIGQNAWATVTKTGGANVSDATWVRGDGLVLRDSLGNTIELTEAAGSSVHDLGVQFAVELVD